MEPILFYGVPQGCSFGSIVALEWLNQPYRLCRMGGKSPELFAQLNPVRETPVLLLESGLALSESAAILHNIAMRGSQGGLSDRVNQALAFLNTTFFAAFAPLWKAYEMASNPPVQQVLREVGREEVIKAHAHLEVMLAHRDWIAGERRTIADAYLAGLARWATYHRVLDQRDYPKLHRLVQRLEADPAVVFAHAIEDERPARSAGGFRGHVTLEEAARIHSRLAAVPL